MKANIVGKMVIFSIETWDLIFGTAVITNIIIRKRFLHIASLGLSRHDQGIYLFVGKSQFVTLQHNKL